LGTILKSAISGLGFWLGRNLQIARLLVVSVALPFSFSGAAWAAQDLRFCNTGTTALHLARIAVEDISVTERIAMFAGWDKIDPGACSRFYRIELATHFAFVQRLSDGSVANPVYNQPTSTDNTIKGLIEHFCVPLARNWNESGAFDEIVSRYTGPTCPAGLTRIRSSIGAGHGWGNVESTLYVDGSYSGYGAIVGRWTEPAAAVPPAATRPRASSVASSSPFVMIGDYLMTNDRRLDNHNALQISIDREAWEDPALVRSGGKSYRASDIIRLFNKKNVVCTGSQLIQEKIVLWVCPAVVFSGEAGQAVLAVRRAPPRGASSTEHVYVEQVTASDVVALIDTWGGEPGASQQAASDELSRNDALTVVAHDRMLGGQDYRALRPLFANPPTFAALEAQLDKLLAADGGVLKKAYDARLKLIPKDQ
jgi:hypothetical protein